MVLPISLIFYLNIGEKKTEKGTSVPLEDKHYLQSIAIF